MIVTVHQPDFMPWLGFFNKIAKADSWIVLDHVENNPRDAAFWCRRVRILANGLPAWISVPLRKPDTSGVIGVPINEMRIERSLGRNIKKCRDTITQAYAKSPCYREISSLVDDYFTTPDESLVRVNMSFITKVMTLLRIDTEVVYSSSLSPQGTSNELLLDLLGKVGATTYLCGNGASGYQIDDMYRERGITVQPNQFDHPVYHQPATSQFVPGLSVIDVISRAGVDNATMWAHGSPS